MFRSPMAAMMRKFSNAESQIVHLSIATCAKQGNPGMDQLDSFMERFCLTGAEAVQLYVTISNMNPSTMPEYFLTSRIFRAIGRTQAATLETPWWQIYEWIGDGSSGEGIGPDRGWKVDMVIYDGGGAHPDEQNIWAVVEVKNGYIDADFIEGRRTDRDRIIRLSNKFKESDRPHLICCGALHTTDRRDYHRRKATESGDLWFEAQATSLPSGFGPHFFCARVIQQFALPLWSE
jgi:hypothetical protein